MAMSSRYWRYLEHFGSTRTVGELAADPATQGVALRHDVDHDLDLALEMAFWEREVGVRATYFVLHTAPYWQDARVLDKILQIQDLGHEVGLHLNVVSEWMRGEVDDVGSALAAHLGRLRAAGVTVRGCSTHGDRLCYERGFVNYWCLAELRPDDPHARESGMSAEGIPAESPEYAIAYSGPSVARGDGATLALWSISMRELGLDYEAVHVPVDRYFTDSGGGWKRSPDPLGTPLHSGRFQVLIHPEHWRGPARMVVLRGSGARMDQLGVELQDATPLSMAPDTRVPPSESVPAEEAARRARALAEETEPGDVAFLDPWWADDQTLARVWPDAVVLDVTDGAQAASAAVGEGGRPSRDETVVSALKAAGVAWFPRLAALDRTSPTSRRGSAETLPADLRLPSPPAAVVLEDRSDGSAEIRLQGERSRHRHVTLGGSEWGRAVSGTGWPAQPGQWYACELEADVRGDGAVMVRLLAYDKAGALIEASSVGRLSGDGASRQSFGVTPLAARFDVAVYVPAQRSPVEVVVRRFVIRTEDSGGSYGAAEASASDNLTPHARTNKGLS